MLGIYAPYLQRVITATTRQPRNGEKHGVDYYFFPKEEFLARVAADEFYEYATVYNNLYGSLKSEIHSKLSQGIDLMLSIDVQGVATFKKEAKKDPFLMNRLVSVFVFIPEISELKRRLQLRGLDSDEAIESRLAIASEENKQWVDFDYCIHGKTKEADFNAIQSIYLAEKLKVRGS